MLMLPGCIIGPPGMLPLPGRPFPMPMGPPGGMPMGLPAGMPVIIPGPPDGPIMGPIGPSMLFVEHMGPPMGPGFMGPADEHGTGPSLEGPHGTMPVG